MLAQTIPALLLMVLLGACADLVDTNDAPAVEGARSYFSPVSTVSCGDCGHERTSAWRPSHTRYVSGTGHNGHGHERHHKHDRHHDHDKRGKP